MKNLFENHKINKSLNIYKKFKKQIAPSSVAEPKLFILGTGSDFDHNFGSGSSSSYAIYWHFKLF